ncbi:zona pellucida sperm-binding protein 3 [Hoplias malabaricus]|uniref:zona pellucida sperm-binding protein 3 n=1 Tax=Hoplias malabaricus TaxID=27720 RepID=UPI003461A610
MCTMLLKAAMVLVILNNKMDAYPFTKDDIVADKDWRPGDKSWKDDTEGQEPEQLNKNSASSPAPQLTLLLPESQRILASEVYEDLFKPGEGIKPMSGLLSSILLPTTPPKAVTPPSQLRPVDMLCHLDRIYVRVLKSLFSNHDAWKHLKVGTCAVNQATDQHYYFLNHLNSCDIKRQENENEVIYSNTLHYEPATTDFVVRELPFTVTLECHYTKHHRAYKVGFWPEVAGETILWGLKPVVSLTPVDQFWKPLPAWSSHVIGQPIYFEAKAPMHGKGGRIYLNTCYISTSPSTKSHTPRYSVLENYGCMVDSKKTAHTTFYPSDDKTILRFSVGALVFKGMPHQAPKKIMYIHCEMTFGPENPTPSAKSCSYNTVTKRWSELYGKDSVCACCDSTCPAPEPSVGTKTINSRPWELYFEDDDGLEPTPKTFVS